MHNLMLEKLNMAASHKTKGKIANITMRQLFLIFCILNEFNTVFVKMYEMLTYNQLLLKV